MNNTSDPFLMHFGIKGMHWGVRRFEDSSGHLTPAGKRRYGIQSARKYYKINRLQRAKERTKNPERRRHLDKRIRRVQSRLDRKNALLSRKDINTGREIVAKNRMKLAALNTVAKTGLTAAGAYYLYQNPKTRSLVPAALAGGALLTANSAKKIPYYTMENHRYKQANKKGSTKAGLTKRQQKLRTAAKVAGTAAVLGGTAYALHKTGALKAGVNAIQKAKGKEPLESNPKPYAASKAILNANKTFTKKTKQSNAKKEKIHNAVSNIKTSISNLAKKGAKNSTDRAKQLTKDAKTKATSKLKNTITNGIDEDDPDTWIKAYSNVRDLINNSKATVDKGKQYYSAAKIAKEIHPSVAIASLTPDIIDKTNSLIQKGDQKFRKFQTSRKRKDS